MDKNLTVYPIPTGNELHVFSSYDIECIKIMDMNGNIVYDRITTGHKNIIDIRPFPPATYIVEASFDNRRKERSIFVKM
jgi:hypothetical protein